MGLQYYPNPPAHNRTRFASNKSTHPQPQRPPILDPIPFPTHPIKILNSTKPSKACNKKKMSQISTGQDRGAYYINHGNRNRVGSVGEGARAAHQDSTPSTVASTVLVGDGRCATQDKTTYSTTKTRCGAIGGLSLWELGKHCTLQLDWYITRAGTTGGLD
jgi:hypothetical protein